VDEGSGGTFPGVSEEGRCPSCGALVSPEANWCGQCFAVLRPAEGAAADGPAERPSVATVQADRGRLEIEGGRATWTCPACETRNPIEASVCTTCGTPFARLFQEEDDRPEMDPQSAAVWSMVFPGLGHWKLGRRADAISRFAMFGWSFGALMILVVSRIGKGGFGPTFPLFVLFAFASATIYVVSAIDAYRIAAGEEPLVSSRVLLWGSAGLVVLSVLLASFVTLPSARR
jgi:ribosomal protein L40E